MNIKRLLFFLFLIFIGVGVGSVVSRRFFPTERVVVEKTSDTLFIERTDTVSYVSPEYIRETIVDTFVAYVIENDTVSVSLPFVQRYYEDSLWMAWVSGFDPVIDSIKVTNKTETIIIDRFYEFKSLDFRAGVGIECSRGFFTPVVSASVDFPSGVGLSASLGYLEEISYGLTVNYKIFSRNGKNKRGT